jgi:hypothetical protein
MGLETVTFTVDTKDAEWISHTIGQYQIHSRIDGELILSDGGGDLSGRILAEICRDWLEYNGADFGITMQDLIDYVDEQDKQDDEEEET